MNLLNYYVCVSVFDNSFGVVVIIAVESSLSVSVQFDKEDGRKRTEEGER